MNDKNAAMRYWLKPVHAKYEARRRADRLFSRLVWRLPRPLVQRCAIRLISHATTGPWSNQVVPDLTAMDALQRWSAPAHSGASE